MGKTEMAKKHDHDGREPKAVRALIAKHKPAKRQEVGKGDVPKYVPPKRGPEFDQYPGGR